LKQGNPGLENQIKQSLQEVVSFLDSHDIQYAIIGGIANQIWGQARFTYDIDIKVLVPDSDYDSIKTKIKNTFPETGRPELSGSPLIVSIKTGDIIVDFLLSTPGYEELLVKRAKQYKIEKLVLMVCTAEDLIIQKAIAGRSKDWLDIEGIVIEQYKILDWIYLKGWLKQFADVLEDQELVNKYMSILNKVSRYAEGN
jgi:predicted nucleotidyltransferase